MDFSLKIKIKWIKIIYLNFSLNITLKNNLKKTFILFVGTIIILN